MNNLNKFYINGAWVDNHDGASLDVINPATEQVISQVACGTNEHVDIAVAAAKAAFPAWSNTPAVKRSEIIKNIAKEMTKRQDELVTAISSTMGCPEHIAGWLHVEGAIYAMELFADHTQVTEQVEKAEKCIIVKEAIGVCAFINPWNFPLHQFIGKVGAALSAGCTMVVKPSEQTPTADFIMAEILEKCGVPKGVFNLVPGTGPVVGAQLSSHPDVDMVSFTGSTGAGIKVAQAAAPTVKRVTQELGGKSALIITADADLQTAVTYGVEDVMLNSGQSCNTLSRMLVPQALYNEAVAHAKSVAENLTVGMTESDFLGPLSSKSHQQKVLSYIQIGLDEGARLVYGGTDFPENQTSGFYVKPTIFADVTNDMRIAQEEIFGPVLCMIPYKTLDSAITIANDSPFGLSSAVFAKDDESAIAIARKIRSGQCMINGGEFNYHAPFGGYKQSGNGREFTATGVEEFLETKAIITCT
ncbi:aldehyde dehydrogenase family protein [Thalassomonas sp. M1454]|uniref:aldehyde dehydrogenase family protein n=1 Tax=Thalassomonas sp. M1454 TaxID=2594477 RepID=UPI00117C7451|nr:aldehyde dehydrogenase family protein [Thalassomonas sp. M1454]TRX57844.1 aldehyde dehydrogenase family protein [Thalassomonas sp. M1454]